MAKTNTRPAHLFGANAAVEQGSRLAWDYYGGEIVEEPFEGPSDKLKLLYDSYLAVAGNNPSIESVTFDARQGVGLMTVRRVYDGAIKYELMSNRVMRPVHEHAYFSTTQPGVDDGPAAPAMSGEEVSDVYKAFRELDNAASTWTAKQKSLLQHLIWGITEIPVRRHVLRQTQIVTKRSTVAAAHDTALTVEAPPDTTAVNSLIGGATLAGLEWLRGLTDVVQIGGKRWAIITEWESADRWSSQLFGGSWDLGGA